MATLYYPMYEKLKESNGENKDEPKYSNIWNSFEQLRVVDTYDKTEEQSMSRVKGITCGIRKGNWIRNERIREKLVVIIIGKFIQERQRGWWLNI